MVYQSESLLIGLVVSFQNKDYLEFRGGGGGGVGVVEGGGDWGITAGGQMAPRKKELRVCRNRGGALDGPGRGGKKPR